MAVETLNIINTSSLIGGGVNARQEWCTVKLKQRVVVYPKDGEREIGEIGKEFLVLKSHAMELVSLDRAEIINKIEKKEKEKNG